METNVNYTIVGAFVISLIAAIILAILWLSSGFSAAQYATYEVDMTESVSGLNTESPVEYNGVNVGSVKSIMISYKDPHLVVLLLSINTTTPITQGTVATLTTRGITGLAFMALKDKGTDLRPLVAQHGRTYPVIPTAPSIFVRLDTALTQINKSFQRISESIQSVLDAENQQSIKETLANLRRVTGTLSDNSEKLNSIIINTQKTTQHLSPVMQAIETQTLPKVDQLLSSLNNMTNELTELTTELKQNPSMLIRGTTPKAPGPGE